MAHLKEGQYADDGGNNKIHGRRQDIIKEKICTKRADVL